MKLYFARHGQTNSNAQAVNQPTAGEDEPLSELGIQQASALAEQLKNETFDLILSSPFKRALQTAEIVNKYHGLEVGVGDKWREVQTAGYVDMNVWHHLFDFGKNASTENKESLMDFFERIYEALDELVSLHQDEEVLVVSHGGVQHALFAYANNLPLTRNMRISPMKNCEYRVYELPHQISVTP